MGMLNSLNSLFKLSTYHEAEFVIDEHYYMSPQSARTSHYFLRTFQSTTLFRRCPPIPTTWTYLGSSQPPTPPVYAFLALPCSVVRWLRFLRRPTVTCIWYSDLPQALPTLVQQQRLDLVCIRYSDFHAVQPLLVCQVDTVTSPAILIFVCIVVNYCLLPFSPGLKWVC